MPIAHTNTAQAAIKIVAPEGPPSLQSTGLRRSRLEMARFNAVLEENAVLGRELGKVQERVTRVMLQKVAEIEYLHAELVRLRAEVIVKDSRIAFMVQDLESQNAELRCKLAVAEKAAALRSAPVREAALHPQEGALAGVQAMGIQLHQKVVLCVGGRFAHHDGGLEDNTSALDANLAAADLVICQTGCISHNAYWRVKDFCKRTGKRCVFVENPNVSSLERELAQIDKSQPAAFMNENGL